MKEKILLFFNFNDVKRYFIKKLYPFFLIIIFLVFPIILLVYGFEIELIGLVVALEIGIGAMMQDLVIKSFFPPIFNFKIKEAFTFSITNKNQKWYNLSIQNKGFSSAKNVRVKIKDGINKSWVNLNRTYIEHRTGDEKVQINNLSPKEEDDFNIGFITEDITKILKTKFNIEEEIAEKVAVFSNGSVTEALNLIENNFNEMFEDTIQILRYSFAKKYNSAYGILSKYTSVKNSSSLKLLLKMVIIWLNDLTKEKNNLPNIYFEEHKTTLEKFNSNKELKTKYLFAFISICGVLIGFHYVINKVLLLSNIVSLFLFTPLISLIIPFLIAKYQVESKIYNQNKIEKRISTLSFPTMIIILLLTVIVSVVSPVLHS